jgi:multidrug efflux pump subunit AcrB
MWIVQLALRRPYTFVVMALLILLLGAGAIYTTRTDIFPEIEIPVVTVIWTYTGLPATEMEKRIAVYSEYSISANVNNIRTMQSQTIDGVSVIRVYFHPSVKIEQALAQVTAISQAILRRMPQGAQPPIILRYNASTVPVLQLSLSSKTLSESEIYDFGIYKLRQQLAPIQGITLPTPYGGKVRQVMVDIDPKKLHARGLSPLDVMNAVNAQNLTWRPAGRASAHAITPSASTALLRRSRLSMTSRSSMWTARGS